MTLDRAEVALRLACASASNFHGAPLPPKEFAASILSYADALLLALTPTAAPAAKGEAHDEARRDGAAHALAFVREFYPPCEEPADLSAREIATNAADAYSLPPVAPKSEAAKYEPRVGDVVRPKDERECDASWRIVVGVKPTGEGRWYISTKQRDGAPNGADHCADSDNLGYAYLRPATPAERKAAGIVEPSPEATRPTHVRITKSASPSRFKDGDVLRVVGWLGDTPSVDIDCHMGGPYVLYDSKWEPADAPKAPAPGEPAKGEARDEAYKALLAYAECDYATCYSSERDWQEVYARHGWTGGDDSYSRLRGMCVRALSLAKSALTPQVRS